MAFDKHDTDAAYDRLILPVLRRNRVTPVIINRRQSNEDLNNQIISQLDSCDFCISDLTYARPSVYFEAGYAQRQVPVIYTVRKDHLGRNQPDELRVHFDLQMKPLITWSGPADAQFVARLERRLRSTVLRDWSRKLVMEGRLERDRSAFGALPVTKRLFQLRRCAITELQQLGFGSWTVGILDDVPKLNVGELATRPQMLVSRRRDRSRFTIVTVLALVSLTKQHLKQLQPFTAAWQFLSDIRDQRRGLRSVAIHNLVFTIRPIPAARIETVLVDLGRGERPGHYRRESTVDLGDVPGKVPQVPLLTTLDYLADVRSATEFRSALRQLLGQLISVRAV